MHHMIPYDHHIITDLPLTAVWASSASPVSPICSNEGFGAFAFCAEEHRDRIR